MGGVSVKHELISTLSNIWVKNKTKIGHNDVMVKYSLGREVARNKAAMQWMRRLWADWLKVRRARSWLLCPVFGCSRWLCSSGMASLQGVFFPWSGAASLGALREMGLEGNALSLCFCAGIAVGFRRRQTHLLCPAL